jgi:hypothetical protein
MVSMANKTYTIKVFKTVQVTKSTIDLLREQYECDMTDEEIAVAIAHERVSGLHPEDLESEVLKVTRTGTW